MQLYKKAGFFFFRRYSQGVLVMQSRNFSDLDEALDWSMANAKIQGR